MKRFAAFLLDIITVIILAAGVMYIVSVIVDYDGCTSKMEAVYADAEERFQTDLGIGESEYMALDEDARARYDAAAAELNSDPEVMRLYSMVMNLTVMMISVSLLISIMTFEFVVPLLLGNGQTIGKKIFGLCVCRADHVRVTPIVMLIRTLLGKFTIEAMVPVLLLLMILFGSGGIMGMAVLAAIAVLQEILLAATKTHSAIHDLLATTCVVDMASTRIFEDEAALVDYKCRMARYDAEHDRSGG